MKFQNNELEELQKQSLRLINFIMAAAILYGAAYVVQELIHFANKILG